MQHACALAYRGRTLHEVIQPSAGVITQVNTISATNADSCHIYEVMDRCHACERECLQGAAAVRRYAVLPTKVQILTEDCNGDVALWDVMRGEHGRGHHTL